MFTFRCQGCGKQHVVDRPFEEDYATKCLRCGERIDVTRAAVQAGPAGAAAAPALGDSITARLPGAAVAEAAPGDGGGDDSEPTAEEVPPAEMGPDDEQGETRPRRAKRRRKGAGRKQANKGDSGDGAGADERRADGADERRADDADEGDDVAEEKPRRDKPASPKGGRTLRERWPLFAAAGVLVLGLIGGGCYFLLAGGKKPEKKEVANQPKPKPKPPAPAPPASTQKQPDKPAPPAPVVTKAPELSLAAARLSAELAADAAATNAKYKDKWVEVSGVLDKVARREVGPPPAREHAFFAAEGGPPVSCDLQGSLTDVARWRRLQAGQPFTARGTYRGDGALTGCELVALAAPADARYKGQPVELTGAIESITFPDPSQSFPCLRLERDVDSIVKLECYFRADAADELSRLHRTDLVTVRGTCGGRTVRGDEHRVRLDNCELVYTSVPAPPAVRRDAITFLREYEEDLRPFFLPEPGAESRVAGTLAVSALDKEVAADPVAAAAKYANKVVTVSGKLLRSGERELILHSGNTDEGLRVACSFTRDRFEDLTPRPECVVRGRWVKLEDRRTLRLVCCESADPSTTRDPRRITLDYLPHVADRQLTYDVAQYDSPPSKDGKVARVVLFHRAGEPIESVVTHAGQLRGKGLFDEDPPGKWLEQKKTTREVRLAGPTYRARIRGAFIEIGTLILKNRREEVVWDQVLKVGARTGDSWKWPRDNSTHEFTVVRFDDEGGRARVIVKELISTPLDLHTRFEKQHIYVRDVGEVEEHEWKLLGETQRLLVGEKRLIENPSGGKAEPPKSDFVGPPPRP